MTEAVSTLPAFSTPLSRLCQFYTEITEQSVGLIHELYAPDAYFKDPFNEVNGIKSIVAIFSHMFVQVKNPRFEVISSIQGEGENKDEAFLIWLFYWQQNSQGAYSAPIRGSSHVKFNKDGQVIYHRDYWDAAEELYETLPVLGTVLRFLKKKLKAT
jgi:steroid Delta-isomerase